MQESEDNDHATIVEFPPLSEDCTPSPTSESEFAFRIDQYCEAEASVNCQEAPSSSSSSSSHPFNDSSSKLFADWYATARTASSLTKALALIEKLRGERDVLLQQLRRATQKSQQKAEKSADDKSSTNSPWTLFEEEHPPPPFGLNSPVVDHLLASWTTDHNKVQFFLSWIQCLAYDLPADFPKGVQVVEVTETIRDGFLMLLLPIMRSISVYRLAAYTRLSERSRAAARQADSAQDDNTFAEIYAEQFM